MVSMNTNAFTQQASSIEEANLPPSKVQQHLSELFRVALCRNDDHNLAASSIVRNSKQYATAKSNAAQSGQTTVTISSIIASQSKIISDLNAREEERKHREKEIMKEMGPLNKMAPPHFALIEKHYKKMVRKIFGLTFDKAPQQSQHIGFGIYGGRGASKKTQEAKGAQAPSLPLSECLPSHLHCAAIMGERTQEERQTFGKIQLEAGSSLAEDKIDWVIAHHLDGGHYYELINDVLQRAQDRQVEQYSKLEAACEYQKFFTDKGVEKRKDKIKLNVFTAEMNKKKQQEGEHPGEAALPQVTPEAEHFLRMLQVHNAKTDKVRRGYIEYCL